jgi:hypothetical protein
MSSHLLTLCKRALGSTRAGVSRLYGGAPCCLLRCECRADALQVALDHIKNPHDFRMYPERQTYHSLMVAASKKGNLSILTQTFAALRQRENLVPNSESYHIVIR